MKRNLILFILTCLFTLYLKANIELNELNNIDFTSNVKYSEQELNYFLDSIGKLNTKSLSNNISFKVDSVLLNQTKLDYNLRIIEFLKLKQYIEKGEIDIDFAKSIFPKLEINSQINKFIENNKLPIFIYSFDSVQSDYKEFAICIGYDGGIFDSNVIFFFKSNKVIAKHKVMHRFDIDIKHFKNEFNETIIYYKSNYSYGTGIWWYQFNVYCYKKDELLPCLTEISDINLQHPWSLRPYSIESEILKTNPLLIKFRFKNQFYDSLDNQIDFINDSTEISYSFDSTKYTFIPKYVDDKLNVLKILTFYIDDNEILFVNVNYDLFKKEIQNEKSSKRQAILHYLNELKNQINSQ